MKRHIIFIFLIITYISSFSIVPPRPDLGEAALEKYESIKSYRANLKKASKRNLVAPMKSSMKKVPVPKFDWTGSVNLIIIPIQFTDVKFTTQDNNTLKSLIEYNVFDTTNSNSIASFYNKSSYGQFSINKKIITNIVTSSKEMSYYGLGDSNNTIRGLPKEALDLAYLTDTAFKAICDDPSGNGIDLNGDGDIHGVEALDKYGNPAGFSDIDKTFIMIYHAGGAEENTSISSQIWSHQWTFDDTYTGYTVGSSTFFSYSTFAEFNTNDGTPVSIACHEFGHQLGASDFYGAGTIGNWSLMSNGVWAGYYKGKPVTDWWGVDFDSYHKYLFGWVDPVSMNTLATGTNEITINTLSDTDSNGISTLYKYNLNDEGSEYFIFSVRSSEDYDINLSNLIGKHGLNVFHMDENVLLSGESIYLDNNISGSTASSHPACRMIAADNTLNTSTSGVDPDDLYPTATNTSFTPFSTPASYSYSGSKSVFIKNIIRGASNTVSMDFVNQNVFIASFALNPIDDDFVHIYLKTNFDGIITGAIDNNGITFQENTLSGLYFANYDFASSLPGTFTLDITAKDALDNVLLTDSADFSLNNSSITNFSIVKDEVNISGINLGADKNILVYQIEENLDDSEIVKCLKVLGKDYNMNAYSDVLSEKEDIYYKSGNEYKLFPENGLDLASPINLAVIKDIEKPSISSEDFLNIKIIDKYSGINKVEVKDIAGKNIPVYKNGNVFTLLKIPSKDYIVSVEDNAGNVTNKTIKKVSSIITNVSVYPNPANLYVNINYSLSVPTDTVFKVYDSSGRLVNSMRNSIGINDYTWDLTDRRGKRVSNGVYFYVIKSGNNEYKGKIAVIR